MNWKRWEEKLHVVMVSAGAAYIYLTAYLTALAHIGALPDNAELGLVRITEGDTTYFFIVNTKDRSAVINFPLIKVEHISPDDPGLRHFSEASPAKEMKTETPRTDVN